ncbi:MAG: hypothetical protein JW727_05565 [Candidatus Aenigmarchaeota archaeon]|nr:hypothetical protein [Candidatus Aenigmarchaeota archaeon]
MEGVEDKLAEKIKAEMITTHEDALERGYDMAKRLVGITMKGLVDVKEKDRLSGKEKIMTYLIGAQYSKRAGLRESAAVSNEELCTEMGLPQGSVLPWTKMLREEGVIESEPLSDGKRMGHVIKANQIERKLKELIQKYGTNE